jgi:PAS domain S-box-containing protein
MRGRVILFNPGAERLIGYSASEVIDKISVWSLYPAGAASEVMASLREGKQGGVGMLTEHRREVLSKSGELVPVNMTASIIYEDGREVATVGIFTDLRDQLRMEQRLAAAQEELEMSARQAMVAQLAGAAAHELNQPLTSILGYAQLIERLSAEESPHTRAVDVILSEAERMAEIVKKIGRITKYETKDYVGSASIMDLDKSAASSGEIPLPEIARNRVAPAASSSPKGEEEDDTERLSVPDEVAPSAQELDVPDISGDKEDSDFESPTRVMRRASSVDDSEEPGDNGQADAQG